MGSTTTGQGQDNQSARGIEGESTEATIEVDVPLKVAYDQWTQFEDYPQFMQGVDSVQQLSDDMVHWEVSIAGRKVSYDAQITEQVPDTRISWESIGGRETGGWVAFEALEPAKTRVTLHLFYAPQGLIEKFADMIGLVAGRAKADLGRFKSFIESRGTPTGEWRGEIR